MSLPSVQTVANILENPLPLHSILSSKDSRRV